jgi:tryptophan synthase alpha subunit
VAEIVEGVIVGSALVKAAGSDAGIEAVRALAEQLAVGSHNGAAG